MSRRLRDNLTSSYIEAANRLNSKHARRKVVAYVESYDDVYFWRQILSLFETDKLYFEVMLPTRNRYLERGKKAALMNLIADKTGQDMIACVDADYDYLIQGASATSKEILNNPYIFHTYAYAIENLQCYAPSLHNVSVAVTLNDKYVFDMEQYLRDFSEAIYPLFVWNIWYYRSTNYGRFTMTDFLRVIETGNFSFEHAGQIIKNIRHKVNSKVEQLKRLNPHAGQSYQKVKDDLTHLGVTPDNTYLFIQGHHLFDKVVMPMLKKVCEKLVRQRESEISRQSVHGTQRRNELSCYSNSVDDITQVLKKNNGFMASELFSRLKNDLQNYVDSLHQ